MTNSASYSDAPVNTTQGTVNFYIQICTTTENSLCVNKTS